MNFFKGWLIGLSLCLFFNICCQMVVVLRADWPKYAAFVSNHIFKITNHKNSLFNSFFLKAYERAKIKETVINSDTQTDTTESSKKIMKTVLLKRFLIYVLFICIFIASIYSNRIEISDDITDNNTSFIALQNQTLNQNNSSNINRMIWYF